MSQYAALKDMLIGWIGSRPSDEEVWEYLFKCDSVVREAIPYMEDEIVDTFVHRYQSLPEEVQSITHVLSRVFAYSQSVEVVAAFRSLYRQISFSTDQIVECQRLQQAIADLQLFEEKYYLDGKAPNPQDLIKAAEVLDVLTFIPDLAKSTYFSPSDSDDRMEFYAQATICLTFLSSYLEVEKRLDSTQEILLLKQIFIDYWEGYFEGKFTARLQPKYSIPSYLDWATKLIHPSRLLSGQAEEIFSDTVGGLRQADRGGAVQLVTALIKALLSTPTTSVFFENGGDIALLTDSTIENPEKMKKVLRAIWAGWGFSENDIQTGFAAIRLYQRAYEILASLQE